MRRRYRPASRAGFISLITLLLVLALIAMLYQFLLNTYFKKPLFNNKQTGLAPEKYGAGTGSAPSAAIPGYRSLLQDTRKTIKGFGGQAAERGRQIEQLTK